MRHTVVVADKESASSILPCNGNNIFFWHKATSGGIVVIIQFLLDRFLGNVDVYVFGTLFGFILYFDHVYNFSIILPSQ